MYVILELFILLEHCLQERWAAETNTSDEDDEDAVDVEDGWESILQNGDEIQRENQTKSKLIPRAGERQIQSALWVIEQAEEGTKRGADCW